ncbi:MAG TPA: hypothetical protein QGG47_16450 [Acidobacteriota bacterium]|nr:hypothetical protein [Acidobacteriota bacterium]
MKRLRPLLAAAILGLLPASMGLGAPGVDGAATARCTCMSPKRPACEVWWQTAAIFIGRVTRLRTVSEEVDGEVVVKILATLRVQEQWRGAEGQREVIVATGAGGGDCGFQFATNRTYLVYANQSARTGRYETGICSRTALARDAEIDLAYLRGLETAKKVVSLYGMVYRERQQVPLNAQSNPEIRRRLDPGGPVSGVTISLEMAADDHRTYMSDGDGWFEISDLPIGEYVVRLDAPQIEDTARWRLRIPVAPACIWRNLIVEPLPLDDG